MAVSIWEGKKADALIKAILQTDKIDKNQGAGNSGKVLGVGPDGNVYARDILSARTLSTLSNLLQHIVYTDDEAKRYCTEFINSLYGGDSSLPVRINVAYDSTGHVIYSETPLSTLREYLTVTAVYADGSYEAVSDYALTGELNSAKSIITVSYITLSEQIEVDVDMSVEYVLPAPIDATVDTSNAITLDYVPRIGTSFSMIIKSVANAKDNDNARMLLNNYEEVTPNSGNFVGLQILIMTINGVRQLKVMFGGNENIYYSRFNDSVNHNLNFAMAYDANAKTFKAIVYADGAQLISNTVSISNTFINQRQLFVGGGQEGWVPYKGMINDLIIYNRVLTSEEMISMIGGE